MWRYTPFAGNDHSGALIAPDGTASVAAFIPITNPTHTAFAPQRVDRPERGSPSRSGRPLLNTHLHSTDLAEGAR